MKSDNGLTVGAVTRRGRHDTREASRGRARRFRARLLARVWQARAAIADPETCPYRVACADACRACTPGLPCRLERRMWCAARDAALAGGMPESAASIRASLELAVVRGGARGEDTATLELRILRAELEHAARVARVRLEERKLRRADRRRSGNPLEALRRLAAAARPAETLDVDPVAAAPPAPRDGPCAARDGPAPGEGAP